jgi:hypothetical protein
LATASKTTRFVRKACLPNAGDLTRKAVRLERTARPCRYARPARAAPRWRAGVLSQVVSSANSPRRKWSPPASLLRALPSPAGRGAVSTPSSTPTAVPGPRAVPVRPHTRGNRSPAETAQERTRTAKPIDSTDRFGLDRPNALRYGRPPRVPLRQTPAAARKRAQVRAFTGRPAAGAVGTAPPATGYSAVELGRSQGTHRVLTGYSQGTQAVAGAVGTAPPATGYSVRLSWDAHRVLTGYSRAGGRGRYGTAGDWL